MSQVQIFNMICVFYTSTEFQQEGDDCGDCLAPPTYYCGTCAPGLECQSNPLLPDAPGTCTRKHIKSI